MRRWTERGRRTCAKQAFCGPSVIHARRRKPNPSGLSKSSFAKSCLGQGCTGTASKSPFSSSLYTARQQEYSNRFNGDSLVSRQQLVVNGRFVGSDAREATSAIQKAIRPKDSGSNLQCLACRKPDLQ